ncbi:MAG: ROK family protein [Oligoflexales bacterium]|nr:ROK family protein [Oligoflexales bacterium]
MHALGIDIGGSSIKGALVDVESGSIISDVWRYKTPSPADYGSLLQVLQQFFSEHPSAQAIGIAYPGVVKNNVLKTAANLDKSCLHKNLRLDLLNRTFPEQTVVLNDADAAGLAELHYGNARDLKNNNFLMLTFGTGIGSALFVQGQLCPNTELGHLHVDGQEGEAIASAKIRSKLGLSWQEWAQPVSRYLTELENLLWPDYYVIGGAVSEHFAEFSPYISCRTPLKAAALSGNAGIIGAARSAT